MNPQMKNFAGLHAYPEADLHRVVDSHKIQANVTTNRNAAFGSSSFDHSMQNHPTNRVIPSTTQRKEQI